jgi:hypothetical protein
MWTTRVWKVTLLCGWLAAPVALAETEEAPYSEAAPDEMAAPVGAVDESQFFMEDPEATDAPLLRYAEPLSCPAVPGGRVWVADTEECGDEECIRKTTVWIGEWTVEDAEMEVRCETDRVVLSTHDWQLVLSPDATGKLDVADAAPAGPDTAPAAGLTVDAPGAPDSET